jgi:hypothetical protein
MHGNQSWYFNFFTLAYVKLYGNEDKEYNLGPMIRKQSPLLAYFLSYEK